LTVTRTGAAKSTTSGDSSSVNAWTPRVWIHRLLARELADPTPALDLVVRLVVRPRMAYLRAVIAALLGCSPSDARVERAAMSVQSQCLALLTHPVAALQPRRISPRKLDALAQHIARFGRRAGGALVQSSSSHCPSSTASPPTFTSRIATASPAIEMWMRLVRPMATPCTLTMRRVASPVTTPWRTR